MPRPPRGQSPRNTVMRLNAASEPKAFRHMGISGFSFGSFRMANSSRADSSAFFEEKPSIRERTPQIKKQTQKALSVFAKELKIRSRMARNSDSPAIFDRSGLGLTGLLYSNIQGLQKTMSTPGAKVCQPDVTCSLADRWMEMVRSGPSGENRETPRTV